MVSITKMCQTNENNGIFNIEMQDLWSNRLSEFCIKVIIKFDFFPWATTELLIWSPHLLQYPSKDYLVLEYVQSRYGESRTPFLNSHHPERVIQVSKWTNDQVSQPPKIYTKEQASFQLWPGSQLVEASSPYAKAVGLILGHGT